jgi:hypothetical protein
MDCCNSKKDILFYFCLTANLVMALWLYLTYQSFCKLVSLPILLLSRLLKSIPRIPLTWSLALSLATFGSTFSFGKFREKKRLLDDDLIDLEYTRTLVHSFGHFYCSTYVYTYIHTYIYISRYRGNRPHLPLISDYWHVRRNIV